MILNVIEVAIPWNEAIINSENFDKNTDPGYIHAPFDYKMLRSMHWQKQ
jgi:hypothetical protein